MRRPMLQLRVYLLFLVQLFVIAPVVRGAPLKGNLSVKLNKPVSNYNLGKVNFVGALIHVSNDFQIPMGVVWVNSPSERLEIPLVWKNTTVLQIIQDVTKNYPNYQVSVDNGIVHVFPVGLIPDKQNFLRLPVKKFQATNDVAEFASWRLHNTIAPRHYGGLSMAANMDPKISLDVEDSTVEGILDALALASSRKIWLVTFVDDTGLTPKGLRRSMSAWSDKPGPDVEQPFWDLIRWGDPLPTLLRNN